LASFEFGFPEKSGGCGKEKEGKALWLGEVSGRMSFDYG
jgi:hypothetical protein